MGIHGLCPSCEHLLLIFQHSNTMGALCHRANHCGHWWEQPHLLRCSSNGKYACKVPPKKVIENTSKSENQGFTLRSFWGSLCEGVGLWPSTATVMYNKIVETTNEPEDIVWAKIELGANSSEGIGSSPIASISINLLIGMSNHLWLNSEAFHFVDSIYSMLVILQPEFHKARNIWRPKGDVLQGEGQLHSCSVKIQRSVHLAATTMGTSPISNIRGLHPPSLGIFWTGNNLIDS